MTPDPPGPASIERDSAVLSLFSRTSTDLELVCRPGRRPRRRSGREATRRRDHRLNVEFLEVRIAPATDIWTGAVDNIWTRAANWEGGVAPVPGDDLVFPDTATRFTPANNFDVGTTFNSITIGAAGYDLIGNALN